jgi:hypothetical protein
MKFNQARITVASAMLAPILDWIIAERAFVCKVAAL